jgi:hypothetical protein
MQQLPGQEPIEESENGMQKEQQPMQHNASQERVPTAAEWRSQKNQYGMSTSKTSGASSSPARFVIVALGVLIALVIAFFLFASLFRVLPGIGSAVANTVSALFRSAPQESLVLEVASNTVSFADPHTVTIRYMVRDEAQQHTSGEPFRISYSCSATVLTIDVLQQDGSWRTFPCNTEYATYETILTVRPSAAPRGTTTTTLTARHNDLVDSVTLFVTNDTDTTDIYAVTPEEDTEDGTSDAGTDNEEVVNNPTPPVVQTPVTPASAPQRIVISRYTGPADLALNITKTGIVLRNKFYDVAKIPSSRDAAVQFTVRNIGGLPSGEWYFVAELPTKGDTTYRYRSPTQPSLGSGMEGTFILSFDDVLEKRTGRIEIALHPSNPQDRVGNNTDSVVIDIDVE